MVNLYESFFRLEEIFFNFYKDLANESEINAYESMRNNYIDELKMMHSRILNKFQSMNVK